MREDVERDRCKAAVPPAGEAPTDAERFANEYMGDWNAPYREHKAKLSAASLPTELVSDEQAREWRHWEGYSEADLLLRGGIDMERVDDMLACFANHVLSTHRKGNSNG